MEKRFNTTLNVPKLWQSLLEIQSLDDLTAFLEKSPPPEALEENGLIRANWPRPYRNDRRLVHFEEDDYTVSLELISGQENYFTVASIVLPTGERYAHCEVSFSIPGEGILEIQGLATFAWTQHLV